VTIRSYRRGECIFNIVRLANVACAVVFCVDHFCLLICYVWRLESSWSLVGMSEESIILGLYMLSRLSYVYVNETG